MPKFACPSCKSIISADVEQRGSVLACSSCGKKIRVPAGKSAGIQPSTRQGSPVREEASESEVEVREERVTRNTPALAQKKIAAPQEEEEAPSRAKPPRQRKLAADEDEDQEVGDQDEASDDDGGGKQRKKKKRKEKESGGVGGLAGILGTIGSLAALAVFVLIISGRGPRWLMDFIQEKLEAAGIPPLVAVGVTVVVFLVPLGLWIFLSLKGKILAAMPDEIDFRAAKTAKFPNLDAERLDQYTADLEALGFEQVIDYTATTELENFPSGFARLLIHAESSCYAEVNQGFRPDGEAVPMRCMFASHLDDGWTLLTTDRAPTKEIYLMRRPRALWRSMPDREAADLYAHHKKMRKKMMKDLEIELAEECSTDAYFEREKEANRERKDAVRARWTLGILLEFFFFDKNPKHEWRGEYAKAASD